jgi:hypothetical protein
MGVLPEAPGSRREGVDFINAHIIPVTDKIFDDFAGARSTSSRCSNCLASPDAANRSDKEHHATSTQ